jgi:hypothetical protein
MSVTGERRAGLRARTAAVAAGALWVAAWVWTGRFALLDDALIHLRYAHLLARTGFMTFDGTTPSYGASSPLYVALLAVLSRVSPDALLVKAVSVVFYLALLAVVVHLSYRRGAGQAGWAAASLILVSPMAVQWLTDGMETSLVALCVVLLPALLLGGGDEPGPWPPVLAFLFGAAAVLLRVELALALFFAVLATLSLGRPGLFLRRAVPLALGGLGGVATLQILFGHVLADTAAAKRGAPMSFLGAAFEVGRSTAASLTLGAGLAALWCGSLLLGLRVADRRGRIALLSCNLLFPCIVASIAVRGQILHGVRHVLWIYLLLISWNLAVLARSEAPDAPAGRPGGRRWPSMAAAALLAGLWIFEGRQVAAILATRGRMLLAMRSEPLARLQGTTGAGFDIGFIAFFTRAGILDYSGLVNGRASAALAPEQRLREMSRRNPAFLYVTGPQAASLRPYLDLGAYRICYCYHVRTLTQEQVYFLAAQPGRREISLPCERPPAGASCPAGLALSGLESSR